MENIGESKIRNQEFKEKFNRENLLKHIVGIESPFILDVGAHKGESVAYLKQIFPKGVVFSIEPDPDSFSVLSANSVEGVHYFNLALSDADGEASFYRNKISHTNSLLKVNTCSEDSIGIARALAERDQKYFENFNEEIKVTTFTLNTFSKKYSIGQIDLLKIDVQGAECRILAGGREILGKTKTIILEISFYDYYENQSSFLDVERILEPYSFRLYSISDISNNPMNGRTDWAEVVYKNHRLLD